MLINLAKTTQICYADASTEELTKHYNNKDKKRTNEDIDVKTNKDPIQSASVATTGGTNFKPEPYVGILSYPLDIDPQQDHLKITKYKYTRTSVQMVDPLELKQEHTVQKHRKKTNKKKERFPQYIKKTQRCGNKCCW